jgi:hypothetical protein
MQLRDALTDYKRYADASARFPGERRTTSGRFSGHDGRLVHVAEDGSLRDFSYPLIGLTGIARSRLGVRPAGDPDAETISVQKGGPLAIRGTEGLVVSYGKCCHPLPGDPIVGHLSSGRGLVVHVENCRNLGDLREKGDEIMPVRWAEAVEGEFSAELRLEIEPNKGVIAELASTITAGDAGIEKINTVERNARLSTVIVGLGVRDRVHLASIMRRMRRLSAVISLTRSRNT